MLLKSYYVLLDYRSGGYGDPLNDYGSSDWLDDYITCCYENDIPQHLVNVLIKNNTMFRIRDRMQLMAQ